MYTSRHILIAIMFVGICAAILAITIVSDSSKLASLTRGVPERAIQYLPLIGRQFWAPTSSETELTEMSFGEGAVAETSFDNQKSFSIEQIIIHEAGIGVGKASQLQIMLFGWFGQWPSSDTYECQPKETEKAGWGTRPSIFSQGGE
jgi:hypothetical protein